LKNYNYFQKILHSFILGNKFIKKSLFEVERIIYGKNLNDVRNKQQLFICGLPRSGTTILLNFIYSFNLHASLTYRDMPFVMMPNFFHKISKKNETFLQERFHKDKIFYDLNSPEALDEVFISSYNEEEVKKLYNLYIKLILKKNLKENYISKNNKNYKRIDFIKKIFPESIILIPFRKPFDHASSLLKQHLNFTNLQNKDKFILKYMNYLGHNEFGINHKFWFEPVSHTNINELNYWLEQWKLYYEKLLNINSIKEKKIYFICFESLNKKEYQNKILQIVQINKNSTFKFETADTYPINNKVNKTLLEDCNAIYNKILRIRNVYNEV
jgi:hypothetical protein